MICLGHLSNEQRPEQSIISKHQTALSRVSHGDLFNIDELNLNALLFMERQDMIVSVRATFFFFFLFVCFTSYFVFSIAVLPHSPGVVYYHLLLRRETRIPGVAPFSFRIGIWDLFVHRGQKSYTPTAFGKLWTTPGVRCMEHASS